MEVAFAATVGRHASCSEHECGARSSASHTSTSGVGGRLTGGERRGAGRRCARTPHRAPRDTGPPRPAASPPATTRPRPHPCPDGRQPAALSRRTALRFLSPRAVASFFATATLPPAPSIV
ncbi:unnamed protein product [Danaus chrysippus]|uniref:(African queen) hypothetical protein n=1 Tax=Danaus chrysippus TaxID=151541 RepID=A0A8J2QPT6_9NEOP|nr:unnamed protein product [Danaus chrysippus]CAG9567331.1 unnamed protein product [Danaus chrysippus]